jgi:hypothetical protein
MKTFDWPWTKELYDMQWQYPYIADIAESPETNRLDEPMQPEEQQRREQPTVPTPQPTASVPGSTYRPVGSSYPSFDAKSLIMPVAIVIFAVIVYKLLSD